MISFKRRVASEDERSERQKELKVEISERLNESLKPFFKYMKRNWHKDRCLQNMVWGLHHELFRTAESRKSAPKAALTFWNHYKAYLKKKSKAPAKRAGKVQKMATCPKKGVKHTISKPSTASRRLKASAKRTAQQPPQAAKKRGVEEQSQVTGKKHQRTGDGDNESKAADSRERPRATAPGENFLHHIFRHDCGAQEAAAPAAPSKRPKAAAKPQASAPPSEAAAPFNETPRAPAATQASTAQACGQPRSEEKPSTASCPAQAPAAAVVKVEPTMCRASPKPTEYMDLTEEDEGLVEAGCQAAKHEPALSKAEASQKPAGQAPTQAKAGVPAQEPALSKAVAAEKPSMPAGDQLPESASQHGPAVPASNQPKAKLPNPHQSSQACAGQPEVEVPKPPGPHNPAQPKAELSKPPVPAAGHHNPAELSKPPPPSAGHHKPKAELSKIPMPTAAELSKPPAPAVGHHKPKTEVSKPPAPAVGHHKPKTEVPKPPAPATGNHKPKAEAPQSKRKVGPSETPEPPPPKAAASTVTPHPGDAAQLSSQASKAPGPPPPKASQVPAPQADAQPAGQESEAQKMIGMFGQLTGHFTAFLEQYGKDQQERRSKDARDDARMMKIEEDLLKLQQSMSTKPEPQSSQAPVWL